MDVVWREDTIPLKVKPDPIDTSLLQVYSYVPACFDLVLVLQMVAKRKTEFWRCKWCKKTESESFRRADDAGRASVFVVWCRIGNGGRLYRTGTPGGWERLGAGTESSSSCGLLASGRSGIEGGRRGKVGARPRTRARPAGAAAEATGQASYHVRAPVRHS
jgi:hypothetical protein